MSLKHTLKEFSYLRAFFSPFKRPKIKFYFGPINIGTPYFYPRRWIKSQNLPGYQKAVPKKVGFDFVGLGWKTKWSYTDYRFEWAPLWSFVFFKWQFVIFFIAPEQDHYWTAWLFYTRNTDKSKSKKERIEQCKKEFPLKYSVCTGSKIEKVDYYTKILKKKYESV